jgi:hypothetical protein
VRLVDAYLPLTTPKTAPTSHGMLAPVDVPASIFLRPVPGGAMRRLERVRLARVLWAMRRAAREGRDVHLWWHPHNFGTNLSANMAFLGAILGEFDVLRRDFDIQSVSMAEAAESS